jgi:hypothetical protein
MMGLQFGTTSFFHHRFEYEKESNQDRNMNSNTDDHIRNSGTPFQNVNAQMQRELFASMLGGFFPSFFTCPIELVMIQQQQGGKSLVRTCMNVYQQYGMLSRGFMRGLVPNLYRDSIYSVGIFVDGL